MNLGGPRTGATLGGRAPVRPRTVASPAARNMIGDGSEGTLLRHGTATRKEGSLARGPFRVTSSARGVRG